MGNQPSTTPTSSKRGSRSKSSREESVADRAKKAVGDLQAGIKKTVTKLDDDHPAAQLIDQMCGGTLFEEDSKRYSSTRSASFYSEVSEDDGSRTTYNDDDTYDDRSRRSRNDKSVESSSYVSQSDYDSDSRAPKKGSAEKASSASGRNSFDTEEESKLTAATAEEPTKMLSKPLASSFAKRCYFTKAGIGKTTQHYEGLTLTGNVVLMLASAMKLKGCPTICDEDLRRVEQTYPNQFSRLPDELLLSSGWRRISKYCHFSNKAIPDGVPFFHSKQRLHPSGGYYFLLASAVGMTRPLDVEPLTRDTLVLLETDFPQQCDAAPSVLVKDPDQWVLVNRFCFFSGGPINTEEDVYYQADFDGNPIFMLAFLSPSLTPEELYKLGDVGENGEPGLKSTAGVQEVESVYDLTDRDFDDLKLYHLGPCRALPQYILQPQSWAKVLPPHFLAARQEAMMKAEKWEALNGGVPAPMIIQPPQGMDHQSPIVHHHLSPSNHNPEPSTHHNLGETLSPSHHQHGAALSHQQLESHLLTNDSAPHNPSSLPHHLENLQSHQSQGPTQGLYLETVSPSAHHAALTTPGFASEFQREMEEEGAFMDQMAPMDEAIAARHPMSPPGQLQSIQPPERNDQSLHQKLDPPDDEPPSLTKSIEDETSDKKMPPQKPNPKDASFEDEIHYDDVLSPKEVALSPATEPSVGSGFSSIGDHNDHYFDASPRRPMMADIQPQQPRPQFHDSPNDHMQAPSNDNGLYIDAMQYENMYFDDPQTPHFETPHGTVSPSLRPNVHQFSPGPPHEILPVRNFPMTPTNEDDLFGVEEKKYDSQEEDGASPPRIAYARSDDSDQKSGEADFIPIKREGYKLGVSSPPKSMTSQSDSVGSHQSSALRGAQEILKRNRRRRLEMAGRSTEDPTSGDENKMGSPRDDMSGGTWESGSELSNSLSGSSTWTDNSGASTGDRSSRRALILQMAKARMKNTRDGVISPSNKSKAAGSTVAGNTIDEETGSFVSATDRKSEANTDFDIVGDLD